MSFADLETADGRFADLRLAFPAGWDAHVSGSECKPVSLGNVDTANGELMPFCGQPLSLRLCIGSDGKWNDPACNRPAYPLIIDCTP